MNESLISNNIAENRLLVEGSDDYHVCYHLLKSHSLHEQLTIVDKNGIDNILQTLEVELIGSGRRRLGIIIDADNNLETRWQSLRNILVKSNYQNVPITPTFGGTIIHEIEQPTVGIWLMPDNQIPGMLEHFLSFLVPPNDILWISAKNILEEVMKQDCRFPVEHKIKAHIHTWLAWQEEPGKPLGQAITKRYLDPSAPHAQQFIKWIRNLLEPTLE